MTEATTVNPSIVVLKTGEKIITLLQEVFEGEGEARKGICLLMGYPYALELIKVSNTDEPEQDLQVKYSKWCPYSVDSQYRIPYDGILTIGVPDPGLASAYLAKVEAQQALENTNAKLQQEEIEKVLQQQLELENKEPLIEPEVV